MERPEVLIARVIGQPIDSSLPTPVLISQIADIETAEPGEDVYTFTAYDDNVDTIYTATDAGELDSNRKSPSGATLLQFAGLQTDLAYVTINEVLNAKDQTALARKKAAIARGMDKEEIVRIISAILQLDGLSGRPDQSVTVLSGEDLYDGILKMVHKVEDFGDKFLLIVGSTVSEKIDTFDKDNADNFHYRVGLKETMANLGITKVKVPAYAKIKLDGGASASVLGAHQAILVCLESQLKVGKPILFVRRKINPEIAAGMGVNPDEAYRLISVAQTPTVISSAKNILGYGCFGYENLIEAIVNYKAICYCNVLA